MTSIETVVEPLKAEREGISQAIAALEPESGPSPTPGLSNGQKRPMSAAVRRRIVVAQRARWAKVKGALRVLGRDAVYLRQV
jgi:hypothetical protein